MNSFLKNLENLTNVAYTENAAKSYLSTKSNVLDFFSKSGALRGKLHYAIDYFVKAYAENPDLALKALFYARDVRGGQGERDTFYVGLRYLAKYFPQQLAPNISLIPEYGRWDDLLILFNTPLEYEALNVIGNQLKKDRTNERPSLLAKWLPSENASSKASKNYARRIRTHLKMTAKQYRKMLSSLRSKIKIVEKSMSANQWENIDYENVPSQAARIYKDAFLRHDEKRYNEYIEEVRSGKKEIKAATLYPHQIVHEAFLKRGLNKSKVLDTLWNNLPNYIEDGSKAIAVVDTSGSMSRLISNNSSVIAIEVSIALGMYLAERNEGMFKNTFLTFSEEPELQKIKGQNILEKVRALSGAYWNMNTNLVKVFQVLLNAAIKSDPNDIPDKVVIISDMQFDQAVNDNSKTNFEYINEMYKRAGIKKPDLIFWNVCAYGDSPITKDENGTFLVSGFSPNILKHALNTKTLTAYDLMMEVLNSERYAPIKLGQKSEEKLT